MNNLLSYCGLVDAKISDLPVIKNDVLLPRSAYAVPSSYPQPKLTASSQPNLLQFGLYPPL